MIFKVKFKFFMLYFGVPSNSRNICEEIKNECDQVIGLAVSELKLLGHVCILNLGPK